MLLCLRFCDFRGVEPRAQKVWRATNGSSSTTRFDTAGRVVETRDPSATAANTSASPQATATIYYRGHEHPGRLVWWDHRLGGVGRIGVRGQARCCRFRGAGPGDEEVDV